jgi:glycosyltransferase involved in cell wall biosynthesis
VILSVVIITHNEEANIGRTLASVQSLVAEGKGEIIVVDSGSTDRTVEIAKSYGAKVFVEEWKGYSAQKNSAIDKAAGDWILSLDADEEVGADLAEELTLHKGISGIIPAGGESNWCLTMEQAAAGSRNLGMIKGLPAGYWISRKNHFLGRWIKRGGFWPEGWKTGQFTKTFNSAARPISYLARSFTTRTRPSPIISTT